MKSLIVSIALVTLVLTMSACIWAGPITSGYTDVTIQWFDDFNEVKFNVINNTSSSVPLYYLGNPYAVLIDKFEILTPSYDPTDVVDSIVPTGWEWKGTSFTNAEVAEMSGKYDAPYSIAPGGSLIFGLTFSEDKYSAYKNMVWSFENHVLAVEPDPITGTNQYTPFTTGWGGTWFDEPGGGTPHEPVPEASTLIGFGSALAMASPGIAGWLRRRKI